MALIKHIASRNSNYGDSIEYLLFQHNEITGKPILDDQGRLQYRNEYFMDGINCEPLSFDQECEKVNNLYHKNQTYKEVKSHHYILSFEPKDALENGLTGERAQALGIKFAKKHFAGHQVLVVTHTDGHNESGNIHVHMVLNSVRKYDIPKESYMTRDCDYLAGFKYHETDQQLNYLKKSVMDMCNEEGLSQVDLLSPAAQKITQKEYWATRRGQENLNQTNKEIRKDGLTPATEKFQTQKQYIRDAIDDSLSKSDTPETFKALLFENHRIVMHESRGRFSYIHPDREKPISSRSLGSHYSKEYILSNLGAEQIKDIIHDYHKDPVQILYFKSELRLVVNLQTCVKAQQSQAYANKVKITNLQQMAKTIIYVEEHQYNTKELLQEDLQSVSDKCTKLHQQKQTLRAELTNLNKQIHYTGQYFANKSAFIEMLKSENKSAFRQNHLQEISAYEEAREYLKPLYSDSKLTDMKTIKNEKALLSSELDGLEQELVAARNLQKELQTVHENVTAILGNDPNLKSKEHEAEL
ncbi:MAG: hypothetical protein PHC41_12345 [Lachnospiraceae bacterium]|nr:hypothetical protein [Lachnospiraceae bacterium]MDD3616998.1 hypothetical protein [Lachnospiraceae bacterium]